MPSLDEIVQLAAWLWGGQIFDDAWSLLRCTHDDAATKSLCAHGVKHFMYVCSSVVLGGDEGLNRA